MKKRFIVLIDFSEYSANLLKYAYAWSRRVDAGLVLVHQTVVAVPALADHASRASIAEYANEEALGRLKGLKESVLSTAAEVSYSVSDNFLQLSLAELLSEPYRHLIFVGLKGTGLLKKIFLGSVAVQVIEIANIPVVALPKEIEGFSPGKLFVAVSDKYPLNVPALNSFLELVGDGIEKITFFHLAKPGEEVAGMESQLGELVTQFGAKCRTAFAVYEGHNAFVDIKTVINDKTDEVLVVQKGGRLLADHLFRKFLINELVYEGHTPLVVLPGVGE